MTGPGDVDFFAIEAGEYLEQLDAHLTGAHPTTPGRT